LLITTAVVMFWQIREKIFLSVKNLSVLALHFALIYFWIKYAFFLKESGALYYGEGISYWQVTFKTLIETITFRSDIINILVLLLCGVMFVAFIMKMYKLGLKASLRNDFIVSYSIFMALVAAFFILNKFFGVNYPEDRTGLFFYVFFIASLAFMINDSPSALQLVFLYIPLFFIFQLAACFNLRVHAWPIYETFPQRFFDRLVAEQDQSKERITIGGHRVREFIYGFMNYNSGVKLNHMTSPEELQMNCDYAIAYKKDKPYYEPYYNELDSEKDWDFVLLKRKVIPHREVIASTSGLNFSEANEYYNTFEKLDTAFSSTEPFQASFNFDVSKAPVPFNAWLVLQVDAEDPADNIFVRTPLNLLKYDWNGTRNFSIDLVTGNVPSKTKRIVAYLWNIEKHEINIKINSFRLYRLKAAGINVKSPIN
jgi:hypothetical protein